MKHDFKAIVVEYKKLETIIFKEKLHRCRDYEDSEGNTWEVRCIWDNKILARAVFREAIGTYEWPFDFYIVAYE